MAGEPIFYVIAALPVTPSDVSSASLTKRYVDGRTAAAVLRRRQACSAYLALRLYLEHCMTLPEDGWAWGVPPFRSHQRLPISATPQWRILKRAGGKKKIT